MRVLLVLSQLPIPEGGAAGRYAVATILGLRERGHDVTVLAADLSGRDADRVPAELDVEVVDVDLGEGMVARARRWTAPRAHLGRGTFAARALELARDADVVHLDEVDAASADVTWPAPSVAHLAFLTRQDRDLFPPWSRSARTGIELWRAERAAVRRCDHLLANSSEVAAGMRRMGARTVSVVPLPLDPRPYGGPAPLEAPVVGIIGTAGWPPTAGAVARLLALWPAVRAQVPDATLELAGRGMSPAAFGAGGDGDGVRWRGEVPSAADFLRGLGVLLYPVPRGSGTKIKVLEALLLGVPVVTTPAGAEGLEPTDGVLVARDDAALVEHAVRLLRDREERLARGAQARAAFEARHTPAAVAERLEAVYAQVAGRRHAVL